ncbi:MAG: TonB-dependent receptor [Deltaproteobacteria bacterium]|nr:TonB-dependent receptor [Deltaproteobacteria bacterium]
MPLPAPLLLGLLVAAGSAHAGPGDDEPGAELVVTATRTATPRGDAPVAVELITREDIAASGAENLADLLEGQPGLDVERSYLGAALRMQGMNPDQVLILVDGERVLGAKDGVIDLGRFPVENIQQVEIVKGPGSALYGADAMGGVVNLITRTPDEPVRAEVHLRGGERGTADASASVEAKGDRLSGQLVAGLHQNDGYDLSPQDEATTASAFQQWDVSGQGRAAISPNFSLGARGSVMRRNLQGVEVSGGGAVLDRLSAIEEVQLGLTPRLLLGARSMLTLGASGSVYREQQLVDQRGATALDTYEDHQERLGELSAQLDRATGDSHLLTVGAEAMGVTMESPRLDGGTGARARGALFVQDVWRVPGVSGLSVVPGARLELDSWYGLVPTPKLAIRWQAAPSLTLRVSAGAGYRAPSFKELLLRFENPGAGYVVQGSPTLRPETSRSLQLGAEWAPNDAWWLSANVFHNDLNDLITITTLKAASAGEPAQYGYTNVASAWTAGLELAAQSQPTRWLDLKLTYTLTESRDETLHQPLEGRARHRGTAQAGIDLDQLGLSAQARAALVGARPLTGDTDADGVPDPIEAPPYAALDLRLQKRLLGRGAVALGVDNLLNAGDPTLLTMPPRLVYLSLDLTHPRRDGA